MGSSDRFLVTGACGCIGAWVVYNLAREGIPVAMFDLSPRLNRLQLIMTDEQIAQIPFFQGDISNYSDLEKALKDFGVNRIIHLAGLQLPFCKANPINGALVNVVGTVNVFEGAKRTGIPSVAFASSTAVYGLSEEYPQGKLAHEALLKPRSHYGVYKQANEGTAKIYWMDDGLASIGLRPYVVYGAGRDQGMTSTPTKAILAAAIGRPYKITFGGRYGLQYGDDVAKVFIQAARCNIQGAETYNIGGSSVSSAEVITCIEQAAPEMQGKITYADVSLPFPAEIENSRLAAVLGILPETQLQVGVTETLKIFRQAIQEGRYKPEEIEAQLK